jgi:hypothetical protein
MFALATQDLKMKSTKTIPSNAKLVLSDFRSQARAHLCRESEGENGSQFQRYRVLGTHNSRSISKIERECV